jgi:hypothetical protein
MDELPPKHPGKPLPPGRLFVSGRLAEPIFRKKSA